MAPGVKHGEKADMGSQVFGVGCNAPECFRSGAKEDVVDDFLILPGKRRNAVGQGENHMEIRNRQKLRAMVFEPLSFGKGLTLRAVAIAAGIVADPALSAAVALIDVAAQRSGSADFDGMHDLLLL